MRISDWSSDVCSSDLLPDSGVVALRMGPQRCLGGMFWSENPDKPTSWRRHWCNRAAEHSILRCSPRCQDVNWRPGPGVTDLSELWARKTLCGREQWPREGNPLDGSRSTPAGRGGRAP